MGILQSLFSQQDEYQRVLDQLEILGLFWDKQQKWNQYANKNKDLREKVRQVEVKHEKQNEDRRIHKLIMLHQHEIDEEKSRKEQSVEMQEVRKELTEHRQQWKGVVDDLNSHQAAMHTHLSGRILTKGGKQQQLDQNKDVLKTIMQKVQQRMQPKQVCVFSPSFFADVCPIPLFCSLFATIQLGTTFRDLGFLFPLTPSMLLPVHSKMVMVTPKVRNSNDFFSLSLSLSGCYRRIGQRESHWWCHWWCQHVS